MAVRLVRPQGSAGRRRAPTETDSELADRPRATGSERGTHGNGFWRKGRKSSNVRVKTPALAPEFWHPIEVYAERDRARKDEQYVYADAASHMLNVAGFKLRAKLLKRGTLTPWKGKE